MKGIIFNLLEEVVIRDHGADTWDELLSATCLDGAYTSLGSYPDEHSPGTASFTQRCERSIQGPTSPPSSFKMHRTAPS
jgi:hypothetical protein